jgi:hypothetical protein
MAELPKFMVVRVDHVQGALYAAAAFGDEIFLLAAERQDCDLMRAVEVYRRRLIEDCERINGGKLTVRSVMPKKAAPAQKPRWWQQLFTIFRRRKTA